MLKGSPGFRLFILFDSGVCAVDDRSRMSDRRINSQTTREQEARNRALHVLARMRRTASALTPSAREEHIDPRTVKKLLGPELWRLKGGRDQPTKTDRQLREMLIPTSRGTTPVSIRGSEQASLLGRYMASVGKYLRTGDSETLDEFEGRSIAGHRLITDLDTLRSIAEGGALELDSIYALPEASS